MTGPTTYFDLPIEGDPYVPKSVRVVKDPIRVLITEAGSRTAYCLIYKICQGDVFGSDQEVILHLVNSKGTFDHKSILYEIEECGFHLLKDTVITSDSSEVYKDVDVAVIIFPAEQVSGFSFSEIIVGMVLKLRQLARNVAEYCNPHVKIIIASPSTKTAMLAMHIMKTTEREIPSKNFSAVTLLDEAIARSHLAARLKTTTDNIKNLFIWGMTCPDVHNATVHMFPPGDRGCFEKKDVPVSQALKDDKWLRDDFVELIYRRVIRAELLKSGKSLAVAIAKHLRALFQGTEDGEIVSMGVLAPDGDPFLIPKNTPFSFPVTAKNGQWKIVEDLKYDVRTHLCIMKTLHRLETEKGILTIHRLIDYMLEYEETTEEMMHVGHKKHIQDMVEARDWDMKYYLSPLPEEALPRSGKERQRPRKSIAWEDYLIPRKEKLESRRKSSIRFSFEDAKKTEKLRDSILKNSVSLERIVLPPIQGKDQKTFTSKGKSLESFTS